MSIKDPSILPPNDQASLGPMDDSQTVLDIQGGLERYGSFQRYGTSLDVLGKQFHEISENKESLHAAGSELIEAFSINEDFFESDYRALLFVSVSSRLAELNNLPSDRRFSSAIASEREFIADTTFLLVHNFSEDDTITELKKEAEQETNPKNLSDAGEIAIYDKYTDESLSVAMTEAIADGLLKELKDQMGITKDNETPYTVRVLSIASQSDLYGLRAAPDSDIDPTELTMDELREEWKRRADYQGSIKKWKEDVQDRSLKFRDELGTKNTSPAWVATLNGQSVLCISMPLAEKILYKEEVTGHDPSYSRNGTDKIDFATLKHEYVHTQTGFKEGPEEQIVFTEEKIDGNLGLTFEERRAEYFSGDKLGYVDAKQFCSDLALLTGDGIQDILRESESRGRKPFEIIEDYAKSVGLKRLIEIVAVVPANYVHEQARR